MTAPSRAQVLCGFLGKPWVANAKGPDAYDCWHLATAVSRALFGRELPNVEVPAAPTWPWMIQTIATHPERSRWRECKPGPIVKAGDGSIVLMARLDRPAHIGLWLTPERRIIHADPSHGVVVEPPVDLGAKGWRRLLYFEPI